LWDGSRDVRRQKRSVQHGENIAKGFGNQQNVWFFGLENDSCLGRSWIVGLGGRAPALIPRPSNPRERPLQQPFSSTRTSELITNDCVVCHDAGTTYVEFSDFRISNFESPYPRCYDFLIGGELSDSL
jgi:hypothetical protein